MSLTVVIPWRPAPTREPAYAFVTDWYARHVPEATVRAIDTADDVFVLSACRNEAVRSVPPGEVVVINDADTFPEVNVLRAAVEAARTSGRVHCRTPSITGSGRRAPRSCSRDRLPKTATSSS